LNEPDLKELPEEIRKDLRFVAVENLEQVLEIALPKTAAAVADTPATPEPL
jgi:ATP-dependent Lon protease